MDARYPVFAALAVGLMLASGLATGQDHPASPYADRPLALPPVGQGSPCPVSIGNLSIVPRDHAYIFMAGGHFFGRGPVHLALSWKPADSAFGFFELDDRMPVDSAGYRLKTPWVMHPDYVGEALVRGALLGIPETVAVSFSENSQVPRTTSSMILRSLPESTRRLRQQANGVDAVWGFWPSSMIIPGPGCYALQIDTRDGSDVVVFEFAQPAR